MATRVIFRTYRRGGDVIALFPDMPERNPEHIMSYMHIGQHYPTSHSGVLQCTRPSTPDEYAELYDELVRIGYDDLKIAKRR